MKICSTCGIPKSPEKFSKNRRSKDGLKSYCKDCQKKIFSRYYDSHRKEIAQKAESYRLTHPDWYEKIKKEKGARQKARYHSDPVFRKRHIQLKEESRKRHPEITQVANANRWAKHWNVHGRITVKQWREIKRRHNSTCQICKRKEPEVRMTIDHIKPMSQGGENTTFNIQPLCLSCNSRKQATLG